MQVGAVSLEAGAVTAVGVSGSYAYVGTTLYSRPGRFWAVDVADPAHPVAKGSCDLPDALAYARQIQIVGDYAYVAAWANFYVIDVSNPVQPFVVGSYTEGLGVLSAQVAGGRATLLVDDIDTSVLVALDISDPAHPAVLARQPLVGRDSRCAVEDDLVYVAGGNGLWIYRLGQAAAAAVQVIDWHDPLCMGWRQRYTLSFTNRGDVTLTGVRMVDTIPAEPLDVLLAESSPGAVFDGGRMVSWEIGAVAPGETVIRYLEIRLWSGAGAGSVLHIAWP